MADALRWAIGQGALQFPASASNGLDVHAGDQRQEPVAAVTDALGLQGHQPASLLFIEPAEQEVESEVELPIRVIPAPQAIRALALVDVHDRNPLPKPPEDRQEVL